MCYKVPLDNIWYISKSNTKFLKIFLKGKTTEYSVLFIWKIAFTTLVICDVDSAFWEEMLLHDFRQVCQRHYTQRILSLSFEVPQLLSSWLYSPMLSGCQKKYPILWNPGSKDSASRVFNFFQLFCQYSTKLFKIFWIWYTVPSLDICF